jgi:endonuclease III
MAQILENQHAAAEAVPCDVELVKLARKKNCPACLPGGRYDVPKLRKWITEHRAELTAAGDALSLRDKKLNEEIRKLCIANDKAEALTVLKKTVCEKHRELGSKVKELVYAKMENEYPPLFSNDVVSNRMIGRKLADQLLGLFQDMAAIWEK